MMERYQLDASEVRAFVLAGSAIFTIENTATGNHFTFRIEQPDSDSPHFVSVLTGSDNLNDYSFLGTIFDGAKYFHGKKSAISEDAPSAKAFAWFFKRISSGALPATVAIYHLGHCGRCGKPLSHPVSCRAGLGPKCRGFAA